MKWKNGTISIIIICNDIKKIVNMKLSRGRAQKEDSNLYFIRTKICNCQSIFLRS